jgi:hypothetical protein
MRRWLARAHENNIARYRRLVQTRLSDIERHFIESRLAEEQTALSMLALAQSRLSCSMTDNIP